MKLRRDEGGGQRSEFGIGMKCGLNKEKGRVGGGNITWWKNGIT